MFRLHIVDLGIAIPLQQSDLSAKTTTIDTATLKPPTCNQDESGDFLVLTLDQTTISACSRGAIISSGLFKGFCLRFAENFQLANSNWKPTDSSSNRILNVCRVPSGHYSMHSLAKHLAGSTNPKWFLNVQWAMEGIDIHVDSIIGKRFSQLIRMITSTNLIEPMEKFQAKSIAPNPLGRRRANTMHLDETNDPDEDSEKRQRLEYEYSNLGRKIAAMK